MENTRVLIIDEDREVGTRIKEQLQAEGFTAGAVTSPATGWPLVKENGVDIALVDRDLKNDEGLKFVKRAKEEGASVPIILLSKETSSKTIGSAFAAGAEDYVSKPIVDAAPLVARMRTILDRQVSLRLFDMILGDLSKTVLSGTGLSNSGDFDGFKDLAKTLYGFRREIGKRPPCVVIDDDENRRNARCRGIYDEGVIATGIHPSDIKLSFQGSGVPLVVAVSLEYERANQILEELAQHYPATERMAFAFNCDPNAALAALQAGAADFAMLDSEGYTACTHRIGRLVRQSRRHHVYLQLVKVLYDAALKVRPDLADDIIYATKEEDRPFIVAR